MVFLLADGGEVDLVVEEAGGEALGAETPVARVAPGAEGDDLFGGVGGEGEEEGED